MAATLNEDYFGGEDGESHFRQCGQHEQRDMMARVSMASPGDDKWLSIMPAGQREVRLLSPIRGVTERLKEGEWHDQISLTGTLNGLRDVHFKPQMFNLFIMAKG